MSKTYKTVTIPASEDTVVDRVFCDVCKKEIEEPDSFEINHCEVECQLGDSFPEGSSWESLTFDICSTCFKDKLVEWFKSFGSPPTKSSH